MPIDLHIYVVHGVEYLRVESISVLYEVFLQVICTVSRTTITVFAHAEGP